MRRTPSRQSAPLVEGTRAACRGIDRKRRAKRPRHALEAGFGDVMAVRAVERLDVQRQPGVDRERLEELAHQLGVERPDLRRRKRRVGTPGTAARRRRRATRVSVSSIGSRQSA